MSKKDLTNTSYEEALERLEGIIEEMEDGSIPLADLVAQFEEGAKLLKICQCKLKDAELKISKLDIYNETQEAYETD